MCRWIAYSGPEIYLKDLVIEPKRSLLVQSWLAQENYVEGVDGMPDGAFPTNGDGFGLGWYGDEECPGIYRELRPAWADQNLISLARHIRSGLFFAHVRASHNSLVQRTNAHPFSHRNWMFQHNGEIPGFPRLKRDMALQIDPELFPHIQGTTDAEMAFFLALTLGLDEDPQRALEAMIAQVERLREAAAIDAPLRFTCALSDGERLYALRYSSDNDSKTLYGNVGHQAASDLIEGVTSDAPAQIIVSEPLDDSGERWEAVPESSFVIVRDGELDVRDFRPAG
jgi:glutamine amidotransferase